MRFILCIVLMAQISALDTEYAGYTGTWIDVVATAYSPNDGIDSHYHETKGDRWRWITADHHTDVRQIPYGVAVPNDSGTPRFPYGTQVIIPFGYGYLDGSKPNDRVFPIDDTGSRISKLTKSKGVIHIDLRYMQTSWASKWETKTMKIFIISGIIPPKPDRLTELQHDLFWDPKWNEEFAKH